MGVQSFDAAGPKLAETVFGYDLLNRRTSTTQKLWSGSSGTRDLVTAVTFDPVSNVTRITDPLNRETTFDYDKAERRVKTTDAAGNVMDYVLDNGGNVTLVTTLEKTPAGGTVSVVEKMEYDALNRQVAFIDALNNRSTTTWDARDLPRVTADAENFLTTYDYDGLNRRTKTTRPEGISETFEYDASSRLTSYKDARQQETTYDYDALNRLRSKTYPDTTVYNYAYDPTHNVTQVTDPNGSVIVQTWDPANRMTRRDVTLGGGVIGPTVETYTYDGLGRVTQGVSGAVTTALAYDSVSRVVSEATDGKTVEYTFDDVSNLTEMLYPSGLRVGRGYDPLDRVLTVGPESATPGVFDSSAGFDYRGPYLQAAKHLGNGLDLVRQYDPARRVLEEVGHNDNNWLIYHERLGWSPRNLKTHQIRLDTTLAASTFGYDGAARLTIRSGDAVPSVPPNNVAAGQESFQTVESGETFGLDSAQNLVTRQSMRNGVAGPVVPLTPDGSGRNRPGTMGGVPLSYDANGNLIAKGDLRFEYDFRNRLTRIMDDQSVEVASYTYDAFNRRTSKTVSGTRTEFVWAGWQAVEEYEAGTLSRRRLFGSGLDEIVFEQADVDGDGSLETSYYPLYDSVGNLVALTGSDGTAFERYSYTPFGRSPTIQVDALAPLLRQLLIRGDAIRVDLSEEVVSEEVLDSAADGSLRVEEVGTGTALDLEIRFPSIPPVTPPQSTTGDVDQAAAASTMRTTAGALSGPTTLSTTLDYRSDQEVRRFALGLVTPPAAGTELRLVIPAEALRDPFGNAATVGVDQTFLWPSEDTVLADTEPPAVHAVRLRQGYLEIEFDEEPDVGTVPSAITVTPSGGSALSLGWSGLGDGFTVRTDEKLPAGTFDLQVDTTLQDLAGTALPTPYLQQFDAPAADADLEMFEAPDERIIPDSSVSNVFGFQGHPRDPESGLIYIRNRYYDPEIGRFITADPMGYADGPSMYQFAGYSPVNFGDPLGLRKATAQDKAVMAELQDRLTDFDEQWETEGVAVTELLEADWEPVAWWAPGEKHKVYDWVETVAENQATYERVRAQLQRDYDSFVAAVEEADDDGAIDYFRGAYYTATQEERDAVTKVTAKYLWPLVLGELASMKAGRGKRGSLVVRARPGKRGLRIGTRKTWTTRMRLRQAGGVGLPGGTGRTGPFRFRPIEGYNPAIPLRRGPHGGYMDRFGNEWVRGPAHGRGATEGHAYEWDVRLSPQGQRAWGSTQSRGLTASPTSM